tara:strand:+ start:13758 stop:14834 length:1077 start_codon:yes stop_codon:yes gene_type:complete
MRNIKPYKLVSQKTWELLPEKSSKLDWNEGDFEMIDNVKKDVINFIRNRPLNWYPNLLDQTVLAGLLSLENNIINKDMIQYFPGSDSIHRTIVNCYLKQNDKVLIVKPSYDNFRYVCEVNGVNVDYFELEENGIIDFQLFEKNISNDIKLVYFVNPNNPTGLGYSLEKLASLIKKNTKTKFLIDEAYADFWGHSMVKYINELNNVIITKTMSKSFGLAGFRFGYCIASKEIIDSINYFRNPKDINTLSLVAVKSSIENIKEVKNYILMVREEREKFQKLIQTFDWVSSPFKSKTNFLLLKFESEKLKLKLIDHLLLNKIFVRNFDDIFNSNCFLRISIGNSKTMKLLSSSIIQFSNSL